MISSKARIPNTTVLWIIVIAGTTLIVYQWISFSCVRSSLENALSESKKQKEILKSDLTVLQKKIAEQEKNILSLSQDREKYLSELYKEKQRAYTEAECLRAKLAILSAPQNMGESSLQSQNERLRKELAQTKEELRLWEGKIKNLEERELVLRKFSITKRALAQRVKALKDSARRIMSYTPFVAGNNGYLIKSGRSTLGTNNAVELGKIIVDRTTK